MASGDIIRLDRDSFHVLLYDVGATTAGNGPWIEVPPYFSVRSFYCDPSDDTNTIGADTVQIEVRNGTSLPGASTSGANLLASALTTTGAQVTSISCFKYVRAVKAGTAKTVKVSMVAGRND